MGLVLKTCEHILGLKNISRHELFLFNSRCKKGLVMSTRKPDLLVCLYYLDVPGIRVNTLVNLFQINFSIFPISFFIVLLAKSSK